MLPRGSPRPDAIVYDIGVLNDGRLCGAAGDGSGRFRPRIRPDRHGVHVEDDVDRMKAFVRGARGVARVWREHALK